MIDEEITKIISINGLTQEDYKAFFEILLKANIEQLFKMESHITTEILNRKWFVVIKKCMKHSAIVFFVLNVRKKYIVSR